MNYKFEVSDEPARPVLSMRTVTAVEKLPDELGRAYMAIAAYLNELGGSRRMRPLPVITTWICSTLTWRWALWFPKPCPVKEIKARRYRQASRYGVF